MLSSASTVEVDQLFGALRRPLLEVRQMLRLTAMGFTEEQARNALDGAGGDVERVRGASSSVFMGSLGALGRMGWYQKTWERRGFGVIYVYNSM